MISHFGDAFFEMVGAIFFEPPSDIVRFLVAQGVVSSIHACGRQESQFPLHGLVITPQWCSVGGREIFSSLTPPRRRKNHAKTPALSGSGFVDPRQRRRSPSRPEPFYRLTRRIVRLA